MSDDDYDTLHGYAEMNGKLLTEIEALRAENARLREALKPFGALFLYPDDLGEENAKDIRSDDDWDEASNEMIQEEVFISRCHIRAARKVVENKLIDEIERLIDAESNQMRDKLGIGE